MYVPLIKKRTGRYGNNHWMVYSPKLKRDVNLFSDLELDHWVLLETDPNVETFCEQPDIASDEEDDRTSILDTWVKYKDNTEVFIEIKYSNDLDNEDVQKQISTQKKWCEKNGKAHRVMTEKDIRNNLILLENLKEMIPYLLNSSTPVETDQHKISEQLRNGRVKIQNLHEKLKLTYPRLFEAIFCMIYKGEIQADIDSKHLSPETEVWIGGEKEAL